MTSDPIFLNKTNCSYKKIYITFKMKLRMKLLGYNHNNPMKGFDSLFCFDSNDKFNKMKLYE